MKTVDRIKEFRKEFAVKDPEGVQFVSIRHFEKFITEALSQQQQEDYQEVLDLDIMKDEENPYKYQYDPISTGRTMEVGGRNELRAELRTAIAEKRGKV